jgi:hypothetical protein
VKLFRRRDERPTPNPYLDLRSRFLDLTEDPQAEFLRGAAFELGTGGACATVVCVADGTTSLYLSTGGGQIGLGEHEPVRRANAAFRAAVLLHLDRLDPVAEVPLVGQGDVHLVAVTADGLRLLACRDDQAAVEGSVAWPLYVAGQDVVTQIRLLDEINRGRKTY